MNSSHLPLTCFVQVFFPSPPPLSYYGIIGKYPLLHTFEKSHQQTIRLERLQVGNIKGIRVLIWNSTLFLCDDAFNFPSHYGWNPIIALG